MIEGGPPRQGFSPTRNSSFSDRPCLAPVPARPACSKRPGNASASWASQCLPLAASPSALPLPPFAAESGSLPHAPATTTDTLRPAMIEPGRDILNCASRSDKLEGPCPSYRRCRPVQIWYPIAKCWSPSLHAAALPLRHHDPHDDSVGDRLCLDCRSNLSSEYGPGAIALSASAGEKLRRGSEWKSV